MNADVSGLTSAASPGAAITSSGRGATAAQPSPASTPSAAVPAATASAATTAGTAARQEDTASSPRAGSGKGIGTVMVASSVRDIRAAGTAGVTRLITYLATVSCAITGQFVRFGVHEPARGACTHPARARETT